MNSETPKPASQPQSQPQPNVAPASQPQHVQGDKPGENKSGDNKSTPQQK